MKASAEFTPYALPEMKDLAEHLLERVVVAREEGDSSVAGASANAGALVIGLYGNLGAGKTTFMQFFGAALGVQEKILSPTFVIEKIYKIPTGKSAEFDHLIHIDAYRLESSTEMRALGWDEIVANPRNIICIEWADKIADLLPSNMVRIDFEHLDEQSRNVAVRI